MTWLISLGTALLMAVLGAFAMGVLADRWTVWFRVTSAEGAAGYFVLLYGLLGAVGGFLVGLLCARYAVQGDDARFLHGLGLGACWVLGVVGVLAVVSHTLADHPPKLEGKSLVLDVEIRMASGAPKPATDDLNSMVTLENGLGRTTSWTTVPWARAREGDGHWVLPFTLALRSSSAHRKLLIQWGTNDWLTASMPLRSKPTRADFEWSSWLPTERLDQPPPESASGGSGAVEVRYRVGLAAPKPTPPTQAEAAKAREEAMAAEWAQLPAEAGMKDRLPFTRHGVEAGLQQAALEAIRSHPKFDAEFAALLRYDDAEVAAEVLRLVPRMPGPAKLLIEPVAAAGRDVLRRLEGTIDTPEAADPSYEWAADISQRFSGWMAAAMHLRRQAGGDFSAELRPMLQVARKRPDSHALRQDVVRVASFYLREWTGEAPLPTDPPPR